jgi:hypothetical protein
MDILSNSPEPSLKDRLECKKLKIEIQKIQLEKKELKKKWPKRIRMASYILPSILGIGAIITAYSTGFVNNQALLNKLENVRVLNQIDTLEKTRKGLKHQGDSIYLANKYERDRFVSEKKGLLDSIVHFKSEEAYYRNELTLVQSSMKTDNQKIRLLEQKAANLYANWQDTARKLGQRLMDRNYTWSDKAEKLQAGIDWLNEENKGLRDENNLLRDSISKLMQKK